MSKYNLVNPGQYKVAGRERPNTIAEERLKAARSDSNATSRKQKNRRKSAKKR